MLSGLCKWEVPVPRYGLLSFGLKVVANQSFEGLFALPVAFGSTSPCTVQRKNEPLFLTLIPCGAKKKQ
ncbi:hypothetical protein WN944_004800 [Citrus x changshan-huyou]|uniref:Uncharacterized protein n=1 Tax=Citrus x changshan-huyou TaxID=2935761 RepID=A0AAP0QIZ3_9ROSI